MSFTSFIQRYARAPALISVALLCIAVPQALAANGNEVASAAVAKQFILALNDSNADALHHIVAPPFAWRRQEWTNAEGAFSLGPPTDKVLRSDGEILDMLADIVRSVRVSSPMPARRSAEREQRWRTKYLERSPAEWKELSLFLFSRGVADVEHIVIVGVDDNARVRGFYMN